MGELRRRARHETAYNDQVDTWAANGRRAGPLRRVTSLARLSVHQAGASEFGWVRRVPEEDLRMRRRGRHTKSVGRGRTLGGDHGGMTWHRAAQSVGTEGKKCDLRRDREARHRAAPFSRGSPDVTVALFNYSHAYTRADASERASELETRRDAHPTMSSSSSSTRVLVRHPYRRRDSTYAPHYVLRVCPPTGRTNHAREGPGGIQEDNDEPTRVSGPNWN